MKKHLKVILCFVITAIIIIGAILLFRHNYVNLEGVFVKRNIKEVIVHLENVDINELNRCSEIRNMLVSHSSDDLFSQLTVFKNLETLVVFNAKEEYSDDFIDMVNKQPNLKTLDLLIVSEVDLNGINNSSVERLSVSADSVKNIQSIADCRSLKILSVNSSEIADCIIAEENTGDDVPYHYYLRDSSHFSVLDNVGELRLRNIYIEDISGLTDMDSLKSIIVSEGFISDETTKAIEENGIDVMVDTIEENS